MREVQKHIKNDSQSIHDLKEFISVYLEEQYIEEPIHLKQP